MALPLETTGPDIAISVRGLTAGYGATPVIKDLNLDIPRSRITTIVGGSGCGKTTLLKCLVGLLRPWSGTVLINGFDLFSAGEEERTRILSRIGLLFQHGAMLNSITVQENVALPILVHTALPRPIVDEMVRLKLEVVGLSHAASMLPSELSGGMRKRAALARAMALDPEVLICDEPSAGLDPQTAAGLDGLLLRLKEAFNMTLVVVTHEIASIQTIADDVVMLAPKGRLVFHGTLQEALKSNIPEVQDFFARRLPEPEPATLSLFSALSTTFGEEARTTP